MAQTPWARAPRLAKSSSGQKAIPCGDRSETITQPERDCKIGTFSRRALRRVSACVNADEATHGGTMTVTAWFQGQQRWSPIRCSTAPAFPEADLLPSTEGGRPSHETEQTVNHRFPAPSVPRRRVRRRSWSARTAGISGVLPAPERHRRRELAAAVGRVGGPPQLPPPARSLRGPAALRGAPGTATVTAVGVRRGVGDHRECQRVRVRNRASRTVSSEATTSTG